MRLMGLSLCRGDVSTSLNMTERNPSFQDLLSPRACRGIPLSNLSFRTNVRNLIEKPLWLRGPFDFAQGDNGATVIPSLSRNPVVPTLSFRTNVRNPVVPTLSFRTNVRNPVGKPLGLGDPSTSLRVTT